MKHLESKMQQNCVLWFRMQYPELAPLLFAVPNGGKRTIIEAQILKREGVMSGVADLILLVPRHGYASLCIEMKTKDGKQSSAQKEWQKKAETHGNKYLVVRSVDEFVFVVRAYLNNH